jgi:type IV pilus assembly protein PilC
MIKAAEATGTLDETLADMDNYYTEINKTKKEMISAMSYPILVTIFAIVVIAIIMIKIIPKFVGIYESAGANINGLTLFIISASDFLKNYALVILLVFILFIVLYVMAYKNSKIFRRQSQELFMKLPVFGKIIIYNEITIFTKTFASLLKNNVFITESIDILSKITNNELYKDIMLDTINNIAKGGKISSSFKNQWAVPDMAYYMIVTGENTGQLAEMMNKVSEYYQSEHKAMVEAMKTLIEPLMIVFLAVVVGIILLAVVLPMFNLYSSIM